LPIKLSIKPVEQHALGGNCFPLIGAAAVVILCFASIPEKALNGLLLARQRKPVRRHRESATAIGRQTPFSGRKALCRVHAITLRVVYGNSPLPRAPPCKGLLSGIRARADQLCLFNIERNICSTLRNSAFTLRVLAAS
jgi:hypothetical protein